MSIIAERHMMIDQLSDGTRIEIDVLIEFAWPPDLCIWASRRTLLK